jgi:hypothetical protein
MKVGILISLLILIVNLFVRYPSFSQLSSITGHLHLTLDPREFKRNYCGWTRIDMNLRDYVLCKGKVDNIHNVN